MPFGIAVSGIRAAAQDLSVIGNNVANAGTNGFKLSRAEFADVYPVSNLGTGKNASGAGVTTARIAQQFTQGNTSFTDNGLDLAINGTGFFVLDNNGTNLYTRAGAFGVDRDGYLVNNQGLRLVAFAADSAGNILGTRGPMQVPATDLAPEASDTIVTRLNLDASSGTPTTAFNPADPTSFNNSTSTSVYDSIGNSHLATTYYRKTAPNTWQTYLYVDGALVDGPDTLSFNTAGQLIAPAGGTITSPAFNPPGAAPLTLTLDYTGTTQFGSRFAVHRMIADGYPTGRLSGLDIDQAGIIFARFTNGQAQVLGQVALANFPSDQNLKPVSDTNWAETFASGPANLGAPGSSNLGLIQSGALEESNVDLSDQLVKLIIAQRNFQANAQVISTADQATQAIINIR